ncbi:LPS export ABC transporter ATP-binding protein [Parasphingorhabdus halotolerans]|uniref:LPS export ABC transporter ATP-binding protein n=1 Tax=Parasphingorhabdus halotolerans TaxID=2725558 RepID=A0A6H2DPH9_9SPHN|nr:LPS export ABC transporter ATP-binding protein [Parasphingorhabdus halotolerans]QJB70244.1 LPS export ABC transporter ATP-binding protein [Parasphingorhabdus halotolerans]
MKHIVIPQPAIASNTAVPDSVLSVVSVSKAFGRHEVLHGISLDVKRGEIVGLLGPDGAGKTVTFFSILGLVKINAGQILIGHDDVSKMPLDKRALRGLGYLPQEASIFATMSVEQNILTVLELSEPDPVARQKKLQELLEEFHIEYVRNAPGRALSGGERRRCEIARAMAAQPSVMLLDEPFAGIDPMSVRDITHMIRKLKDHNIGVLMTDQNVHELVDLLDRVYVIHEGQIVFHGTPEVMLEDEMVREIYLGDEF